MIDIILNIILVIEGLFIFTLVKKLARPVYNYLFMPSPTISMSHFDDDGVRACYSVADATIFIGNGVTEKNIVGVLNHEYLHFVLLKRVSKESFEMMDDKCVYAFMRWLF